MNRTKERFNFRRPEIIHKTKKEKQKFHLNLKPLKNIFYILILVIVVYEIIFSPIFKVKKVEINGVKSVEISDYLNQHLLGRNILLMRTGKFLRNTEGQFPVLSEMQLVRGLPDTIKIDVLERNQSMIICNSSECFEVDNRGYAFQKVDKPQDKVVLTDEKNMAIKEGDRVVSDSFIFFFLNALDEFKKLNLNITSAQIDETTFKVTFVTSEGWSIVTDSSYSLTNQIDATRQIIEKNRSDIHEYIDVRVEGVGYIK